MSFTATELSWSLAQTDPAPLARNGMFVVDDERRAYYGEIGFPVMAYNSQAGGFFGPKYDQDAPDDAKRPGILKKFEMEINCRRRAAAKRIAGEIGADANQVALAWMLGQPMPVTPIVGPKTVEQVRESCRAADLELTPEQLAQLEG